MGKKKEMCHEVEKKSIGLITRIFLDVFICEDSDSCNCNVDNYCIDFHTIF